ncbi:hypothetical protein IFR05_012834 [Cadophora sp. M221]|nr:hypothetical protein IFR05_012834 [Cadophora sp. M221]
MSSNLDSGEPIASSIGRHCFASLASCTSLFPQRSAEDWTGSDAATANHQPEALWNSKRSLSQHKPPCLVVPSPIVPPQFSSIRLAVRPLAQSTVEPHYHLDIKQKKIRFPSISAGVAEDFNNSNWVGCGRGAMQATSSSANICDQTPGPDFAHSQDRNKLQKPADSQTINNSSCALSFVADPASSYTRISGARKFAPILQNALSPVHREELALYLHPQTSSCSSLTSLAGRLNAVDRSFYPICHKCEVLEDSLPMVVCWQEAVRYCWAGQTDASRNPRWFLPNDLKWSLPCGQICQRLQYGNMEMCETARPGTPNVDMDIVLEALQLGRITIAQVDEVAMLALSRGNGNCHTWMRRNLVVMLSIRGIVVCPWHGFSTPVFQRMATLGQDWTPQTHTLPNYDEVWVTLGNCLEDCVYPRPGMWNFYGICILVLEGSWQGCQTPRLFPAQ